MTHESTLGHTDPGIQANLRINTHLRASTYFGFYLLLPPSQWRKGMSITGHFSFCQNKVRAQPTRWLTSRGAKYHTSDVTGPCHADVSHFSWKQLWDSVLLSTFFVQDICPRQLALKQIRVSLLIPPLTQGCSGVNRLQISSYPKPQKLREFGDVTTDWDDSGLGGSQIQWEYPSVRQNRAYTDTGETMGKWQQRQRPCCHKPLKARSCQELEEAGHSSFQGVVLVTP